MISIIIPVYREADRIGNTIPAIKATAKAYPIEMLVVDADSRDGTADIAAKAGARTISSAIKSRAVQMNLGAAQASGEFLLFLHADTRLPEDFTSPVLQAFRDGAAGGCFRLSFDHSHWFLKGCAWFTRFDFNAVRFGDQGLFVRKEVFLQCGGFREALVLMEDQEIIHRIKKYGRFCILPVCVVTSARKYLRNGIYRLQGIFFLIWLLYYAGLSQEKLVKFYQRLVK